MSNFDETDNESVSNQPGLQLDDQTPSDSTSDNKVTDESTNILSFSSELLNDHSNPSDHDDRNVNDNPSFDTSPQQDNNHQAVIPSDAITTAETSDDTAAEPSTTPESSSRATTSHLTAVTPTAPKTPAPVRPNKRARPWTDEEDGQLVELDQTYRPGDDETKVRLAAIFFLISKVSSFHSVTHFLLWLLSVAIRGYKI